VQRIYTTSRPIPGVPLAVHPPIPGPDPGWLRIMRCWPAGTKAEGAELIATNRKRVPPLWRWPRRPKRRHPRPRLEGAAQLAKGAGDARRPSKWVQDFTAAYGGKGPHQITWCKDRRDTGRSGGYGGRDTPGCTRNGRLAGITGNTHWETVLGSATGATGRAKRQAPITVADRPLAKKKMAAILHPDRQGHYEDRNRQVTPAHRQPGWNRNARSGRRDITILQCPSDPSIGSYRDGGRGGRCIRPQVPDRGGSTQLLAKMGTHREATNPNSGYKTQDQRVSSITRTGFQNTICLGEGYRGADGRADRAQRVGLPKLLA